jgi:Transposase DNA-binding/Transposase Tn5 dimerisation domain
MPIAKADESSDRWIDSELAGSKFKDERLGRRFRALLSQLSSNPGESIPAVCQDWANTKAAYRFLDNARVDERDILAGHLCSTRERFAATAAPVLVLHDTTEFSYFRDNVGAVGQLHKAHVGNDRRGHARHRVICGVLMHSSLVVTTEGLPLGLAAIKFWTRSKFKGTNALKKRINPTRVPIEEKESIRWLENLQQSTALLAEPQRCVHIGDRESDIYELFCKAQEEGTHFVLRTCADRRVGDGTHTVAMEMKEVDCKGLHRVEVQDSKGNRSEAILELQYRRVRMLPPDGKKKLYPAITVTVLHAKERGTPRGRAKINWKLITNLPVQSRSAAIEKLNWYAMRWKIEVFHKILKSGCKAEESRLRTAARLVNLLATFCILSWRIFWLTMIKRSVPKAPPTLAFTSLEIRLIDQLIEDKPKPRTPKKTLNSYVTRLARLGGYLARASDPPPGNKVIWRGMSRLTDIELGFLLGAQSVGN